MIISAWAAGPRLGDTIPMNVTFLLWTIIPVHLNGIFAGTQYFSIFLCYPWNRGASIRNKACPQMLKYKNYHLTYLDGRHPIVGAIALVLIFYGAPIRSVWSPRRGRRVWECEIRNWWHPWRMVNAQVHDRRKNNQIFLARPKLKSELLCPVFFLHNLPYSMKFQSSRPQTRSALIANSHIPRNSLNQKPFLSCRAMLFAKFQYMSNSLFQCSKNCFLNGCLTAHPLATLS